MTARAHGLFETLRVEGGVALRLSAHLARLAASAAALGLAYDEAAARQALERALDAALPAPVHRVRLDLAPDGSLRVEARPFRDAVPGTRVAVVLSEERVDAEHPRQRHKTTDRAHYDAAVAWAAANDVADVIFLNGRGTVAEGAVSTVFVRAGGVLRTPPVADGALPGVLRAELLARGEAVEGTLVPADLLGEIYLGNDLRGLRRARLDTRRLAPASGAAASASANAPSTPARGA